MNAQIDISSVILKTKRLTLRPFNENDLDDFYEYAKVEGVGECAGWPHHSNKEITRIVLKDFIEQKKTFAIVYENKVIGSIGIEMYDENVLWELSNYSARELGYVLSKDYWNKGIMTEAIKEVIRYLFEDLNLEILVCGHYDFNQRSYNVQKKCGFKHYRFLNDCRNHLQEKIPGYISILAKTDALIERNYNIFLIQNIENIHTTKLGYERIRRSISESDDEILYQIKKIILEKCYVIKKGKNLYVYNDEYVICINHNTLNIITCKKVKK